VLDDKPVLIPAPALEAVPVNVPDAIAPEEWTQAGATESNAIDNIHASLEGAVQAKAEAGKGNGWENEDIPVSPVIAGKRLFAMDAHGYVSAHPLEEISRQLWISEAVAHPDNDPVMGGGLAYADGRVFAVTGMGELAALAPETGKPLWQRKLGIPVRVSPKPYRDMLLVLTIDNQLFAIRRDNGKIVWSHRGATQTANFLNASVPAISGDEIVVPYSSGFLHALRGRTGQELWTESLSRPQRTSAEDTLSGIGGNPLVQGNIVFAISSNGSLMALHIPTGGRIWEQPISSNNSPWLAGQFLYVLTPDYKLVCLLARDGRIKWVTEIPRYEDEEDKEGQYFWSGPVMVDGLLALYGAHGELLTVNPESGQRLRQLKIPSGIETTPIYANGKTYAITRDAEILLLGGDRK
jgi:outer membrane protein assembly factor BamB